MDWLVGENQNRKPFRFSHSISLRSWVFSCKLSRENQSIETQKKWELTWFKTGFSHEIRYKYEFSWDFPRDLIWSDINFRDFTGTNKRSGHRPWSSHPDGHRSSRVRVPAGVKNDFEILGRTPSDCATRGDFRDFYGDFRDFYGAFHEDFYGEYIIYWENIDV